MVVLVTCKNEEDPIKNEGARVVTRVGIKPGFYHKAQPGGFYGFYEGGFWGFYGFYVGFINLKVYHNSHNKLLHYSCSVLTVLV